MKGKGGKGKGGGGKERAKIPCLEMSPPFAQESRASQREA